MNLELAPDELDRQRGRWLNARRALRLDEVGRSDFAIGGSARRVKDLSVRILVLPADPLAHAFDLDDNFKALWQRVNIDPALEREARWGNSSVADSDGLVICDVDGEWWHQCCVAMHSGAIDISLGRKGAWNFEKRRMFDLIGIVGRVWSACGISASVARASGVAGPWEVSLALIQTAGAELGGFARGWREECVSRRSPTAESNVLLRRECVSLDGSAPKDVAFSIGCQIENVFGFVGQRFRSWDGKQLGDFDAAKYSHSI